MNILRAILCKLSTRGHRFGSRYRKASIWYRTCKDCGRVRETNAPVPRKKQQGVMT